MKKVFIFLPLLLLTACVTKGNSNNSSSITSTPSLNEATSESTESENTFVSQTSSNEASDSTFENEENTYTIKGYFKDNKDNPISDLTLGLYNEDKVLLDSVLTDVEGQFTFTCVKEGNYYIQVIKAESSKYKNLDKKFTFTINGNFKEVDVGPFILEIDDTSWSDLV